MNPSGCRGFGAMIRLRLSDRTKITRLLNPGGPVLLCASHRGGHSYTSDLIQDGTAPRTCCSIPWSSSNH